MLRKKIFITGSVSLLGKYTIASLSPYSDVYCGVHKLTQKPYSLVKDYIKLDVENNRLLEKTVNHINPDVVIHLASLSNIEACEKNPHFAFMINTQVTQNLCQILKGSKVHLLFASSNMVFGNKKQWYSETDITNPINVYGNTKARAEEIVQNYQKSTIVRCTTLFGWPPLEARSNDLPYYLKQLKQKRQLHLVSDRFFNPVSAKMAAGAIEKIISQNYFGILNIASEEVVTRFTFTQKIADCFNMTLKSTLVPVASNYFPDLAPRPSHACLAVTKLKSKFNFTPGSLMHQLVSLKTDLMAYHS